MTASTLRMLAVFVLAAAGAAREPDPEKERRPITANLENVDAPTTARMLKKAAKLKIEFAPQLADTRINLRLIGVPTFSAMKEVAEAFRCELQFLGKKRWRVVPAWQMTIYKAIETNKVAALDVKKMPVEQFLGLLRSELKIDITLDPKADRETPVTLRASKISYRKLLDKFVKARKLRWELRYGVLYIASADRFRQMPVLVPRLDTDAIRKLRLPVSFKNAPLGNVGQTLRALAGKPFVIPKENDALAVTARAREITFEQALALILYPHGFTAVEKDDAIHVRARKG